MAQYVLFSPWSCAIFADTSMQDFPYAPRNTVEYELEAINNATFLSEGEKAGVFSENSRTLFQ